MADTTERPLPALNRIPREIQCASDYETLAQRFIDSTHYAYIAGGSGGDLTTQANRSTFSRWSICPRLLRDVRQGNTALTLAGLPLPHPILLAPVAYQTLAHPLGELETARGAAALQSPMIVSTLSSHSLEEIAKHAGSQRWFQLYLQPQRDVTLDLVRRAEAAGYSAIVITLDASIQLPSQRALRAGFTMPTDCIAANLSHYPQPVEPPVQAGESRIFQGVMRHAPLRADLEWLLAQTRLPVWLKGVLHPDDARSLQSLGISGLVVSNHGGRTLDGAPSSLTMLPQVRAAVGEHYPLLFDGGIRSGADIFKAIALGADAVLIGRLQLYALSVAGALGVAHLLRTLREELEATMALAGCATLHDIRATTLLRAD